MDGERIEVISDKFTVFHAFAFLLFCFPGFRYI